MMLKIFKNYLPALLLLLALTSLPNLAHAIPANHIQGDYDGDGKSDLGVALVDKAAGNTAWLARLTSGQAPLFWTFGVPADALVQGRFFAGNNKTYPGVVYVRSSSFPIEWYIKNPAGQDVFLHYGLPGDTIPNQGDLDCDGVTDLTVVRDGTADHFPNSKLFYVALSGHGGIVVERVFGEKNDKIFTADVDGDGCNELLALRPGFVWYYSKLFSPKVKSIQWGLPGDLPLLPQDINGDGIPDFIIARRTGFLQKAYVNYRNGSFTTFDLGFDSSIPMVGKFNSSTASFAWQQRDTGFAAFRQEDGNPAVFSHGIPTNIVIRPDGTVIQPNEDGRFPASDPVDNGGGDGNGGGGENPPAAGLSSVCSSILGSGYLWKPASQDSGGTREGKPLTLFTRNSPSSKSCLNIYAANGQVVSKFGRFASNRFYEGWGCGDGNSGSQIAAAARSAAGSTNVYIEGPGNSCFGPVPNPASRHDKR